MKASEVAELLTYMAAFDRRTIGLADVQAWATLPLIQHIDLQLAKDAVVLFQDQEPDPNGHSHYLDPQQFKRFVRKARERRETEAARKRANGYAITRGPADPRPADFDYKVEAARLEAHADEYDEAQKAANRARLAEMMGTKS